MSMIHRNMFASSILNSIFSFFFIYEYFEKVAPKVVHVSISNLKKIDQIKQCLVKQENFENNAIKL